MENVIVNGNFTGTDGRVFYNWITHNISLKRYDDGVKHYYLSGGEKKLYYDLPPGIYQKIDLSDYYYDIKLDIEYIVSYDDTIYPQRQENLTTNLYIYKISSYSTNVNTIPIVGDVRDYLVRDKIVLNYDEYESYAEKQGSYSITLSPGYYVIGFGTEFIDIPGDGFIADGRTLEGLCINSIEANALELTSGIIDLVTTSDFDPWGIESASFATDPNYFCPVALESNDIAIRVYSDDTLEQSKSEENGFTAQFDIPEFEFSEEDDATAIITGKISFWYHSSLIGSSFAVYLFDRDIGAEYLYDVIEIENNEWTQYTSEFDFWDARFQLMIIPPKESYKSAYLMLNNIKCSLQVEVASSGGQGGQGTFEDPYNDHDGFIYYYYNGKGIYIPQLIVDFGLPTTTPYFAKIDGKYYMSCAKINESPPFITYNRNLCANGYYDTNGKKISDPLSATGDMRYFFEDGSMAINESFGYYDCIFTADENGFCKFTARTIKDIKLALEGYDRHINFLIDIPDNLTKVITASFERQCPYVKLNVTSNNEDVATGWVSSINLIEDGDDYYNVSNTIKVTGHRPGAAEITVSCENIDGSIVSRSFYVEVRDIQEYYENGVLLPTIEFLYDENYITYGETLDLNYRLKPLISSELPLDWQITNDQYDCFTISSDGTITATTEEVFYIIPSCTVTVTNYGSDVSDSCTIYLYPTKNIPVGITCEGFVSSMEVGQTVEVSATTFGEDRTPTGVTQHVTWSSSDLSVAMVDELGTITAYRAGTAVITCTCLENPRIKWTSTVEVTGSATGTENVLQRIELNMTEAVLVCPSPGSSIYGNSSTGYYTTGKLTYEYLKYSFYPDSTLQKNVQWSSDNPSLVKVDKNGRIYANFHNAYSLGFKESTYVRCTSLNNPEIEAVCKVTVCEWGAYHPIIYFSKKDINAFVGESVTISYGRSSCSYLSYTTNCNFTLTKEDATTTTSTISFNSKTFTVNIKEEGIYKVEATCSYDKGNSSYVTKNICTIVATESDQTPIITQPLEFCHALHNGSYILRYHATNSVIENFTHYIGIDGTFYSTYADPLIYNGKDYYYIFGKMDYPGTYEMCVRVVNGTTFFNTTNSVSVTIPEHEDNKTTLGIAKQQYDVVTDDIMNYLDALITDKSITATEHLEFETRFKIFNIHYENLKTILDTCIEYINAEIKAEQATMSTMATALASDGTAVAAYSVDDYTNSNYKNVTDMDYYQNECIKALVQRILELEAKMNELTNNNNN